MNAMRKDRPSFISTLKKSKHQNKTKKEGKNKMKFRNFREMLQWCSTKYLTVNSQRELREMGIDQYCLLIKCYQDFYYNFLMNICFAAKGY